MLYDLNKAPPAMWSYTGEHVRRRKHWVSQHRQGSGRPASPFWKAWVIPSKPKGDHFRAFIDTRSKGGPESGPPNTPHNGPSGHSCSPRQLIAKWLVAEEFRSCSTEYRARSNCTSGWNRRRIWRRLTPLSADLFGAPIFGPEPNLASS